MTSRDFVIWLKGFIAGSNAFNLTPQGWDELKNQLDKVETPTPTENKIY